VEVIVDAFGIFEGGGAKGLAHVGALKAAEERGVRFVGVAGTSAGSIVAALVAAGYTADELYQPGNKGSLFQLDYLGFFDPQEWKNLVILRTQAAQLFGKRRSQYGFWVALSWFLWRNQSRLKGATRRLGLLRTDRFEAWLDEQLRRKLNGRTTGTRGAVAFRDLKMPLKVIAAEVRSRSIRVYPTDAKGNEGVAAAVAASISIPLVFAPRREGEDCLVDGGVLSNFPAWVFDRERQATPPMTPTFGFRLVSRRTSRASAAPCEEAERRQPWPLRFFLDLFQTAVFGDNALETRAVASLHEIPLRVRVGPLDFQISDQIKDDVYRDGKEDAGEYFRLRYVGPRDPDDIKMILKMVHQVMLQTMGHKGHLRVNVMRPVSPDTLTVVYSHLFDGQDDCDDRIEFQKGSGACGLCWRELNYVIADLEDAKTTYATRWKMDKYQQRLVRNQLKSLLSVPIFKMDRPGPDTPESFEKAFLGVLNFDSDERILGLFTKREVLETARECAGLVARLLLNR